MKYECVKAWELFMGSFGEYRNRQIAKAEADNAPEDAIYCKAEIHGKDTKRWARLSEIQSPSTQWYFKQNHPELVEQFTDWNKEENDSAKPTE